MAGRASWAEAAYPLNVEGNDAVIRPISPRSHGPGKRVRCPRDLPVIHPRDDAASQDAAQAAEQRYFMIQNTILLSVPDFDTSIPHSARVYDYWLGGKDNFAADREVGERTIQAYPNVVLSVRANRKFLARAVRFLARDEGIRQFLDVGTGIPSANNTHEVAQRVAPDASIVYVDNDPIVLSHARALLTSAPEGKCAYIDADMRDPDAILAQATQTLDFSQPVAVMFVAALQYAGDDDQVAKIVKRIMEPCVAGSFLVISHPASDIDPEQVAEFTRRFNESGPETMIRRDLAGVARLFDGLDLVDPGVTQTAKWRPDSDLEAASPAALWAGVARKTEHQAPIQY